MSMRSVLESLIGLGNNQSRSFPDHIVYAQDYVPIKDIRRGVIITPDDRYIKILEILPTNFVMRTESEQSNVLYNYESWLRIAPRNTQLKVITKRADTSELIEDIYEKVQGETNEKVIDFARRYAEYVHDSGSRTAVSRRFFLIFEYEPPNQLHRLTAPDEIIDELERTEANIKTYFSRCGNVIVERDDKDAATLEFLYLYYNKRTSMTEPYNSRVYRIESDVRKVNGLSPEDRLPPVDLRDYIAPRGISFDEPGYCVVDGMYKSHLYVDADRFPIRVQAGWIANIVTRTDGIDVDIFTSKTDTSHMLKQVSQKMKFNTIKIMGKDEHQQDFEDVQNSLGACQFIKTALSEGEEAYYMSIFITVCAFSHEELMHKKQALMTEFEALQMNLVPCDSIEKDAFLSLSPALTLSQKLKKRSRRNMTTSALACCYPYTAYELYDRGGILLGMNAINSSLCIINRFNANKYVNANLCIFGTSGAGKSYTLQLIAFRERILGTSVFIITPDKAHEFLRSANAVGGSFVDVSTSSQDCINVMEIRPTLSPMEELIDGTTSETKTWLAEKVENLLIWFSLQVSNPAMTDEEEEALASAIYKTYARKGITNDNASLYIDPYDTTKGLKEMPILGDLYEEPSLPDRIRVIMGKFIHGRAQIFNGQTNVDLDNEYLVFSLEGLKGNKMLAPAMFMVLDIVWSKAKTDRTKHKDIFIDEGWQLVNGSNVKTASFVQNIFKTIRGYGGSAIFATQEVSDLFQLEGGKYGNAIVSCAESKIVLKLDKKEVDMVQKILDLNENEVVNLTHFEQGQALVCTNTDHIPIRVTASEFEHNLITTSAADLEKLYKEKLDARQKSAE